MAANNTSIRSNRWILPTSLLLFLQHCAQIPVLGCVILEEILYYAYASKSFDCWPLLGLLRAFPHGSHFRQGKGWWLEVGGWVGEDGNPLKTMQDCEHYVKLEELTTLATWCLKKCAFFFRNYFKAVRWWALTVLSVSLQKEYSSDITAWTSVRNQLTQTARLLISKS